MLLGAVVGLLVPLLSAGCAGDEALSREQYVAELNAMCEAFSEKEEVIGEPRTLADLVEKGPRILAAFEQAIVDKVHTLKPPEEIADQTERLANLADQQRDVLRELIGAARDTDFAKVAELDAKNKTLNAEAGSIARELGAEACAEG